MGTEAIRLDCSTDFVRSWPGGSGNTKMGANYAPTLLPGRRAVERGAAVNGWLWGPQEVAPPTTSPSSSLRPAPPTFSAW